MKKLFKTFAITAVTLLSVQNLALAQDEEDRFDFGGEERVDQPRERNNVEWDIDFDRKQPRKKKNESIFSKKDFGLILGLNSFDEATDMPELNDWQSRYVALQWRKNHKLITGRHVDVALGTGLEIAWNNYMMKYDEQYYEDGNISDFELVDTELQKSKLVVNNLNLPVMLQFGFKESNFRFGVGAYGGVRINSYQRFEDYNGNRFKEKGDYNLRRWNYGLMAEAGKETLGFLQSYDINPLFNDNNPINANVLSVGYKIVRSSS